MDVIPFMTNQPRKFMKSFLYAYMGLKVAITERNFRFQAFVGVAAVVLSFVVSLSAVERMIIVLCTAIVLASEAMNSAVERLLDFVSQDRLEEIREVKDLMAGAVLLFSVAAFLIGLWIFGNAIFLR
jgi:diacylglycerol kinase